MNQKERHKLNSLLFTSTVETTFNYILHAYGLLLFQIQRIAFMSFIFSIYLYVFGQLSYLLQCS
ncbi:hypothetical protein F4775DRAFT_561195 [Biscogniauxia sp. FL1348]|nr:hypothetical protein F4775DRAFT_561195 [Biscogniauxia sp. FL1348]